MRSSHQVILEENVTTGYAWEVAACSGDLVVEDLGHETDPEALAEELVGAAGARTFSVRGGLGSIRFELRRSWEPAEQAAVATHTIDITSR